MVVKKIAGIKYVLTPLENYFKPKEAVKPGLIAILKKGVKASGMSVIVATDFDMVAVSGVQVVLLNVEGRKCSVAVDLQDILRFDVN